MLLIGKTRSLSVLGFVLFFTFTFPPVLVAEVPDLISYQGYLTDTAGNPVPDGNYAMDFTLYTTEDGDTGVWGQTFPAVSVVDGIINVKLGPFIYPEQVFDGDLYLEVEVNGEVLAPRQRLSATAYAMRAVVADRVNDGGITNVMIADNAVTNDKIDVGAVSSSNLKDGATIEEILDDDGAGSGLDADTLDGLQASNFLSTGTDYGRMNVASNLYEGSTTLTNKYVNQTGDDMTGRLGASVTAFGSGWVESIKGSLIGGEAGAGVYGYASGTGTHGVHGGASGINGVGVYGEATDPEHLNYGGYFTTIGFNGKGVYGLSSGPFGVGVYGKATSSQGRGMQGQAEGSDGEGVFASASGSSGIGVYGQATNQGDVTNYGGQFLAYGSNGRGVFGLATATGDVANYGGYFEAKGNYGVGVFGESPYIGVHGIGYTSTGQGVFGEATGYDGLGVRGLSFGDSGIGVHAEARGMWGRAFEGIATGTTGTNHGGYFEANGPTGRGVFGVATGSSGTGVMASGQAYDFYANGPGTNYGSASSIRWKQSIKEIDGALDMVMQMRGVYFDWDEEHGGQHDIGFVAEEVGQYIPEIVVYEEDGEYATGMDYSKMTPILLQAIKEQQGIISELRIEMETLRTEIKTMKAGKKLAR